MLAFWMTWKTLCEPYLRSQSGCALVRQLVRHDVTPVRPLVSSDKNSGTAAPVAVLY